MCGICGWVRWTGGVDAGVVAEMTTRLRHRGPDGEGLWVESRARVALGHRRLAVLDRSDAAAQPMIGRAGGVLTYNGEVYGYRELAAELGGGWGVFDSTGDTEVVLAALERWGVRALERLDGMFAIAFWDGTRNRLLLARDRLGIKPLFWVELADGLAWASEVQALIAHPEVGRRVDRAALARWLQLGYSPGDETLIRGVRRLPPGHVVEASAAGVDVTCWYDLVSRSGPPRANTGRTEVADTLEDRVSNAVEARLVADVPLGCFLSGGVDSTIVAAYAGRVRPVETLTVSFPGGEDESWAASRTAVALGLPHRVEACGAERMIEAMEQWPVVASDPFADPSLAPSLVLSEAARRSWTVALSGDGGDELCSGYPRLRTMPRLERAMTRSPRALRGLARLPRPRRRWATKLWSAARASDPWRAYAELQGLWPGPLAAALLGERELAVPWPPSLLRRLEHEPPWRRWRLLDALTFLPERVLAKVDRASMRHSLEVRVPLLDHRVVEAALSLPRALSRDKSVLRDVVTRRLATGRLPRRKRGFEVPLRRWLTMDLRAEVEGALRPGELERLGIDPTVARQAWRTQRAGRSELSEPLFALWQLVRWSQALDLGI